MQASEFSDMMAEEMEVCPACGGTGTIAWSDEPTGDDNVVNKVPDPCPSCQGKGKVTSYMAEEIRESFRDFRDFEDDSDPDGPWRDPISGEVDYEAMKEDLGILDGTEDIDDELDCYDE